MAEREDLLAHLAALIGDLEPAGESSQEDLDTLREAITGAFGEEPDVLIHRREVPVLTTQNPVSLPVWAAGRALERTLGSFPRPPWAATSGSTSSASCARSGSCGPLEARRS